MPTGKDRKIYYLINDYNTSPKYKERTTALFLILGETTLLFKTRRINLTKEKLILLLGKSSNSLYILV